MSSLINVSLFTFIPEFLLFSATEIECCCFLVEEYNIETESKIRPILHSSRPIRLLIFCTLATRGTYYCTIFNSLHTFY